MNLKEKISNIEWRTKAFIPTLFILCVISILAYWIMLTGFNLLEQKKIVKKEPKPVPFDLVNIEAKSAFVWDMVAQSPLYQKNADISLPLASLAKVMTALTARTMASELRAVTIKLDDLSPEGDSKLKVASNWKMGDLIDYVLLVSSNDGAHALAASVITSNISNLQGTSTEATEDEFIREMNTLAKKIGLTNSYFKNEHGLDAPPAQAGGESQGGLPTRAGAYGSARDMALLFEYAIKNYPHLLEATRYQNLVLSDLDGGNYLAENTNEIINLIPSPIASKTGSTDLAGGNLVVAFDAGLGHPIVISILGSTEEGRFEDMLTLVNTTIKYLQNE
ncbi:MAG: hypothetical protein AAB863_01300, partial [Patescibacteria group bacterium]